MNQILFPIHQKNIYEGFVPLAESITGWGGTAVVFADLIKKVQPRVIIEVGSWKGQSAITMAEACKTHNLDCAIICVDTWLGSEEHILKCNKELHNVNGYPTLYYQFLSNVVHRGVQEFIVPLPTTSLSAASILKTLGIRANLIYIDANHQYEAVLADLKAFAPILAPAGTMFGHDHCWDSVKRAVEEYCQTVCCSYKTVGDFWILNPA